MNDYVFTSHALTRMAERGIEKPMVLAVANSGTNNDKVLGPTVSKELCGIVAVMRDKYIITAWEEK